MLAAREQRLDQVQSDEAGAAGDEDCVHRAWISRRDGRRKQP
jgi:hypothetical protein